MDYNNKLSENIIVVFKNLHRFIYDNTDGIIPLEIDEYAELLDEKYFSENYSDDSVLQLVVDTIAASTAIINESDSGNNIDLSRLITKFIDKYKIK